MSQDVNATIANKIRALRSERGLSLEALAQAAGVSRSMISLIERGEVSATAVVLDKLATALGVVLVDLFESDAAQNLAPVSRAATQVEWRDPASGYRRRNLSPTGARSGMKLVDVHFPTGARVAYETSARAGAVHQQVWMLDGAMRITVGTEVHDLSAGDCLAMVLDQPVMFENVWPNDARYLVAISSDR